MRGDFSIWRNERRQNFNGVLQQQGRVLLDSDWNAQTEITNDWQDIAGRDIIGAGVAAVPADSPDGFKLKDASVAAGVLTLTVAQGRAWADGLLACLDAPGDVKRLATYLGQPFETPPADPGKAGTRDAVFLEVWREEINGFQLPDLLIEPALGGPDTTERVHTGAAFRLLRLTDPNDTCESVVGKVQDDFTKKGTLTVTLDAPPVGGTPDCPLPATGGYTGFEHNLYRIEIAEVNNGHAPSFKWSQFGGGLVGRGDLKNAALTITLDANHQAITNAGPQQFYLEIVAYETNPAAAPNTPGLGHPQVIYGATVTLGSNDTLTLPDPTIPNNPAIAFGHLPADGNVFFRFWNDIADIAAFSGVNPPKPLQDGILLHFDSALGSYSPGDFWTFTVRAGDIVNTNPLPNKQPPAGVHYHRVPLGILEWTTGSVVIEDCRRVFHPLTRLATCCTYRVGDGMKSHGDFTKIQDAVNSLPASGGEICVLPGDYEENVTIKNAHRITITGCGPRTRVFSHTPGQPVFHVFESQEIKIRSLLVEADDQGIGVHLEGRVRGDIKDAAGKLPLPLLDITLENLLVRAATRSAVHAEVGYNITIRRCRVEMRDVATAWPAVFFVGEDSLIEENVIVVADEKQRIGGFDVNGPLDANHAGPAHASLGGLQLGGTCERVRVAGNVIARGNGDGITLGSLVTVDIQTGKPVPNQPPREPDPCNPCRPGTTHVPPKDPGDQTRTASAGDLYEIRIERNSIFNMGLNGIGVAGFFELAAVKDFVSVHGLLVEGNSIHRCLGRKLDDIPGTMLDEIGYGGIALADVDDLVIRDNFIGDNGPDYLEPVCGIFVLHGQGIEISRNRILNNGAKPLGSETSAAGVKRGRRGGINIVFALTPMVPERFAGGLVPGASGVPALIVHDNVVSVPVGQALAVTALGPVSVVGNEFTSRGLVLRGDSPTFYAATVMIFNLGMWSDLFQLLLFVAIQKGHLAQPPATGTGNTLSMDAKQSGGLEKLRMYFASGDVLFANNQCTLDLFETGFTLAVSSVLILSLDDVGFHSNQCDASLADDFLFTQAFVMGLSVRASDNRFKEGVFNALFSAVTFGLFNTTTDNQSTHCLVVRGWPALTVDQFNTSLLMISPANPCGRFRSNREATRTGFDTNLRGV